MMDFDVYIASDSIEKNSSHANEMHTLDDLHSGLSMEKSVIWLQNTVILL